MAIFKRADNEVAELVNAILAKHETHQPLLKSKATIDLVFAFAPTDDITGDPIGHALKLHGVPAHGIARVISAKDRALGRADAEITLDGDYWRLAPEPEREALLDHELHHFVVVPDGKSFKTDDNGRPVIRTRPHEFEFGWFGIVASRNGAASHERMQAKSIMDRAGQLFWPDLFSATSKTEATRFNSLEINKRK